jgi:hypothetical protein
VPTIAPGGAPRPDLGSIVRDEIMRALRERS